MNERRAAMGEAAENPKAKPNPTRIIPSHHRTLVARGYKLSGGNGHKFRYLKRGHEVIVGRNGSWHHKQIADVHYSDGGSKKNSVMLAVGANHAALHRHMEKAEPISMNDVDRIIREFQQTGKVIVEDASQYAAMDGKQLDNHPVTVADKLQGLATSLGQFVPDLHLIVTGLPVTDPNREVLRDMFTEVNLLQTDILSIVGNAAANPTDPEWDAVLAYYQGVLADLTGALADLQVPDFNVHTMLADSINESGGDWNGVLKRHGYKRSSNYVDKSRRRHDVYLHDAGHVVDVANSAHVPNGVRWQTTNLRSRGIMKAGRSAQDLDMHLSDLHHQALTHAVPEGFGEGWASSHIGPAKHRTADYKGMLAKNGWANTSTGEGPYGGVEDKFSHAMHPGHGIEVHDATTWIHRKNGEMIYGRGRAALKGAGSIGSLKQHLRQFHGDSYAESVEERIFAPKDMSKVLHSYGWQHHPGSSKIGFSGANSAEMAHDKFHHPDHPKHVIHVVTPDPHWWHEDQSREGSDKTVGSGKSVFDLGAHLRQFHKGHGESVEEFRDPFARPSPAKRVFAPKDIQKVLGSYGWEHHPESSKVSYNIKNTSKGAVDKYQHADHPQHTIEVLSPETHWLHRNANPGKKWAAGDGTSASDLDAHLRKFHGHGPSESFGEGFRTDASPATEMSTSGDLLATYGYKYMGDQARRPNEGVGHQGKIFKNATTGGQMVLYPTPKDNLRGFAHSDSNRKTTAQGENMADLYQTLAALHPAKDPGTYHPMGEAVEEHVGRDVHNVLAGKGYKRGGRPVDGHGTWAYHHPIHGDVVKVASHPAARWAHFASGGKRVAGGASAAQLASHLAKHRVFAVPSESDEIKRNCVNRIADELQRWARQPLTKYDRHIVQSISDSLFGNAFMYVKEASAARQFANKLQESAVIVKGNTDEIADAIMDIGASIGGFVPKGVKQKDSKWVVVCSKDNVVSKGYASKSEADARLTHFMSLAGKNLTRAEDVGYADALIVAELSGKPLSIIDSRPRRTSLTEASKAVQDNITQYRVSRDGNTFYPSGTVVITPKLPEGIYKVDSSMDDGLYFAKMVVNSDEILRFDDPRYTKVLERVNKFWALRDNYDKLKFIHKQGVMMYGRPGTGKSVLMKICMEDHVSRGGYVFVCERHSPITQALEAVKAIEPESRILVVLEDFDEMVSYNEHAILELFDGPNSVGGVLFLATTNYKERLPERILRPGRFDVKVEIGNPPANGRQAYFEKKLAGIADTTDIAEMVAATDNFSFAELREFLVCKFCYEMNIADCVESVRSGDLKVVESRNPKQWMYGAFMREEELLLEDGPPIRMSDVVVDAIDLEPVFELGWLPEDAAGAGVNSVGMGSADTTGAISSPTSAGAPSSAAASTGVYDPDGDGDDDSKENNDADDMTRMGGFGLFNPQCPGDSLEIMRPENRWRHVSGVNMAKTCGSGGTSLLKHLQMVHAEPGGFESETDKQNKAKGKEERTLDRMLATFAETGEVDIDALVGEP